MIAKVREYFLSAADEIRWDYRLCLFNHCPHFPYFVTHFRDSLPITSIGGVYSDVLFNLKSADCLLPVAAEVCEVACLYTFDGARSHLHSSVYTELKRHCASLYSSPPSCTPYTQACDKKEVNAAFGTTLECKHKYADFMGLEVIGRKRSGPMPAPSRVWLGN